jgi:hypothetical protein
MSELKFKVGDLVTAGNRVAGGLSKCAGLITGQVVVVKEYDDCPYGIMFIEHERMDNPVIRVHATADRPYYVYESSIKLKAESIRKAAVACDLFE